jgi:hypothetical protein
MVVLSIAVGTKAGKLLLCRDFSDISRTLVEDCTNSLPQLIKDNQEHTFVEHNGLRLNYLPLGSLFLLSINDRASNILEDIEVLRAVQSALHGILTEGITEEAICSKAIDIIFTLDDLISLGHRNISSEGLLSNALMMDSANERLMLLQKEQQEKEAKKKAQEFIRTQQKLAKQNASSTSVSPGPLSPKDSSSDVFSRPVNVPELEMETGPQKTSAADGKKTLKLGVQKKKDKIKESNEEPAKAAGASATTAASTKKKLEDVEVPVFNPLNAAVDFKISERISCELDKEGKMKKFSVKGEITFTINDPKMTKIAILINSAKRDKFAPKVPPTFNKKMWAEDGVLIPRDEGTTFQPRMTISAIKYSFDSDKTNLSPVTFSVWLTDASLTIEAEFNSKQDWLKEVTDLEITIPSINSKPKVTDKSNSDINFNSGEKTATWVIPKLGGKGPDSASIGLELADEVPEDELFPWNVNFQPSKVFADYEIANVKNMATDEEVKFDVHPDLKVGEFSVVAK